MGRGPVRCEKLPVTVSTVRATLGWDDTRTRRIGVGKQATAWKQRELNEDNRNTTGMAQSHRRDAVRGGHARIESRS